jgi:hypothetical protein
MKRIWLYAMATAERMEGELGEEQWAFLEGCQRDWDALPRPDLPLVVGLDGGCASPGATLTQRRLV